MPVPTDLFQGECKVSQGSSVHRVTLDISSAAPTWKELQAQLGNTERLQVLLKEAGQLGPFKMTRQKINGRRPAKVLIAVVS